MDHAADTRPRFVDSYGLLFALLLGIMVLLAAAGDSEWGRAVLLVAISTSTWLALRASDVKRPVLRLAVAVIPIVTALALLLVVAGDAHDAHLVTYSLTILLVVVSPVVVIRRLASHPTITAETFFGAVSVYLLVAMLFATLFALIATVSGRPFFAQAESATAADYLYFSFTTITTTGYGDLTAAGSLGRMTAMIEAVLGQLYLITVVALVVQGLGQTRWERRRRDEGNRPADPTQHEAE